MKNSKHKINSKKIFLFFIFLLLLFLFFSFLIFESVDKTELRDGDLLKAKIGEKEIEVELALSPAKQYLGLSHREGLPKDQGMLFLFSKKSVKSFVMRDMRFDLDIVFIDENKIVDIYQNLPCDKDKQEILYSSSVAVDKVLELNAGFCEEYKIKIGDDFLVDIK